MCVQIFLRFSDSSKPSQAVSFIYELAWLAGIGESEENLPKTSCKVAPVTKVAHIFRWRHDKRKQSASARERWCDVSCDIPYWRMLNFIVWWKTWYTDTHQLDVDYPNGLIRQCSKVKVTSDFVVVEGIIVTQIHDSPCFTGKKRNLVTCKFCEMWSTLSCAKYLRLQLQIKRYSIQNFFHFII